MKTSFPLPLVTDATSLSRVSRRNARPRPGAGGAARTDIASAGRVAAEDEEVGPLDHARRDSLRALRAHRDAQELERAVFGSDYADSDLVFCREDGRLLEPSRISERFAKLAEDAGLPKIRLHDLRHTAATLLLAAGKPAKVVSERLGHSGTATTQDLYQHVTPEFEQDAATAGAAVFGDG